MADRKLTKAQKKLDKNNNGKIDAEDFKKLRSANPTTRGVDPEFSRDVEAANRNRQREQAARIKREMKDADEYGHGGMVKKYRYGGEVKKYAGGGMACKHRPDGIRGGGCAEGGMAFKGVK